MKISDFLVSALSSGFVLSAATNNIGKLRLLYRGAFALIACPIAADFITKAAFDTLIFIYGGGVAKITNLSGVLTGAISVILTLFFLPSFRAVFVKILTRKIK